MKHKVRWIYTGQKIACDPMHIKWGGTNPMEDTYKLQYLDEDGFGDEYWVDVPFIKEISNVGLDNQ